MPSQVDIVNRALLKVSARAQVSRINPSDGSTAGDAASVLFTPTYESLARAAYWNIFRKQAKLTLLKGAKGTPENPDGMLPVPPVPWLYSYAYPGDCIMERYLVPSEPSAGISGPVFSNIGWSPAVVPALAIRFQVAYDTDAQNNPIRVILTNLSQAQAVYTVNQPNPNGWDSQFQEAMVASLGVWLVPALSGNAAMMQLAMGVAQKIVAEARVTDGNEGLMVVDNVPDWIRVRGTTWGGQFGGFLTPYQDMAWPAYG